MQGMRALDRLQHEAETAELAGNTAEAAELWREHAELQREMFARTNEPTECEANNTLMGMVRRSWIRKYGYLPELHVREAVIAHRWTYVHKCGRIQL